MLSSFLSPRNYPPWLPMRHWNCWANTFQLDEICRLKIHQNVCCFLSKKSLFWGHLKVKLNWRILSVNKREKKCCFFFFFLTHLRVRRRNQLKWFWSSGAIEIWINFYIFLNSQSCTSNLKEKIEILRIGQLSTAPYCCHRSTWRDEEVTKCQQVIVFWAGTNHF